MALEKRGDNLYYYRSVRNGEKVRKVYVGSGELARIAHEGDILRRTGREAEREQEKAELERLEALAAPIRELADAAEILAHAHLIAGGYRRYEGHWRLRRDRSA
jgi:hypothetical protein